MKKRLYFAILSIITFTTFGQTDDSYKTIESEYELNEISFDSEGYRLRGYSPESRKVYSWSFSTGKQTSEVIDFSKELEKDYKSYISFSSQNDNLFMVNNSSTIILQGEKYISTFEPKFGGQYIMPKISPNGRKILMNTSFSSSIYDTESEKEILLSLGIPSDKELACISEGKSVFSNDGNYFAFGCSNFIYVCPTQPTNSSYISPKFIIDKPKNVLYRKPCFSPNSRYISAISVEEKRDYIVVWDISKKEIAVKLEGYRFNTFCFSPDGKYVATNGSLGNSIFLWDISTGKIIKQFKGEPIDKIIFHPNEQKLVTLKNNVIKLWSLTTE